MQITKNKNVQIVLSLLEDEIRGDTHSALKKLSDDYKMTWVYQKPNGKLFPCTQNLRREMDEMYAIKGREYDIKHIATGRDLVMLELVESYPDPHTGDIYRTPLVLALELKSGKVHRGRHYCDPDISYLHLSKDKIARIYK